MSVKPKINKKSFGPESDFWNELKGKQVCIERKGRSEEVAELVWVDTYSIGIRRKPFMDEIVLLYKSAIDTIKRDNNDTGETPTRL